MNDNAPQSHANKLTELGLAIVLSAAGLLTTYASYQSTLWDGDQAAAYTRSGALRVAAASAASEAETLRTVEVGVVSAWLDAKARNDDRLAGFYQARAPAEFRPAFDGWVQLRPLVNPKAPLSPFAMPNYIQPGMKESRDLEAKADATFEEGQKANEISDAFVHGSVILGMAMFLSGICQVFPSPRIRILFLVIAAGLCAFGFYRILSLPLQFTN